MVDATTRMQNPARRLGGVLVALGWAATLVWCGLYLAVGELAAAGSGARLWLGAVLAVLVLAALAAATPLLASRADALVQMHVRDLVTGRVLAARTALDRQALPAVGRVVSTAVDGGAKVGSMYGRFVGPMIAAVSSPLLVVVVIGFTVDWLTAGVLVLLIVLVPFVVGGFQRLFRRSSAAYRSQSARLAAEFLEAIRGLRMLTLNGSAQRYGARLAVESERQRRAVMRLLFGNQMVLLVTDVVFFGGVIGGAAALGVRLARDGSLEPGRAVALILMALLLTRPIDYIGQFFYIGMAGAAAKREVQALLDSEPNDVPFASDGRASAVHGDEPAPGSRIELADVEFAYPGFDPVISGLCLTVNAGECVAFSGASGTGKSTILSLLAGDLRPGSGSIRVGGADPADRGAGGVAVVHQSTYLFTGSIADNLRFADPDVTDDSLWAALEAARLADDVRRFPCGLDTQVGEFGQSLSGGQAQRLSLTRALIRSAPVILLDEPTSHVDRRSEDLIIESLRALKGRRTIVVASHSPAVLALADRIVCVEELG